MVPKESQEDTLPFDTQWNSYKAAQNIKHTSMFRFIM